MDVLAHSLWTNLMYKAIPATRNDRKTTWWGIAFGVLPDFASFTPIFIWYFYQILTGKMSSPNGRPDFDSMPLADLTHTLYNFTHSFVIFLFAMFVVWAIWKKFPWFLLGWGLHISIDIFTHTKEFFVTPFLYPISDFGVNGIPWSHPVFMAINYSLLLILYLLLIPAVRKLIQK